MPTKIPTGTPTNGVSATLAAPAAPPPVSSAATVARVRAVRLSDTPVLFRMMTMTTIVFGVVVLQVAVLMITTIVFGVAVLQEMTITMIVFGVVLMIVMTLITGN